jgi:surface antigen
VLPSLIDELTSAVLIRDNRSGLAPVLSFIYKVKTMLKTQSRSLNPVKAAILISAVVVPFLHSQAAHANYMDTYFKDGMTIRLVTPVGLNVNLPYATNGGMINTFIPDNTNDWKFKVIRSSADGIKFQRIGTNHLITAKKFPSANLFPLEAWQNVGGEDKFQTWVAIPTQPGFFALCLKAQRDQCMNVPNSKDKTKLTTYNFNPNDRDQMFSVGILSNTPPPPDSSTLGIPVNWNNAAYRGNNGLWPGYAPPSVGGTLDAVGNCTWYANGRLGELGYSNNALRKLVGNARDWDNQARNAGISIGTQPRVGAIAQWESNHVAVVEQINSDGTIIISESSYPSNGARAFLYETRKILASGPSNYIYVPR